MLNCRQVSERASDHMDGKNGWWTRLQIYLHLLICENCRRFMCQLKRSSLVASRVASRLWHTSEADARNILDKAKQTPPHQHD